ncbi:MAG: hypothetical protein KA760_18670 [Steroidobacteraceae bacterium]|nr:hypothetical protein [Steroidobacteraceae bacterium]
MAREPVQVIIRLAGQAPSRRRPFSSNVMRLKPPSRCVGFGALCCAIGSSFAIDVTTKSLALGYAVDRAVCTEIGRALDGKKICRPYDGVDRENPNKMCSPEEADQAPFNGRQPFAFAEVATNQYGYTHVARPVIEDFGTYAIIYVDQFEGDNNPRTVQTWRVRADAMNSVLALPPGPFPYDSWVTLNPRPLKEDHSREFAAVLREGQKLSDEWSSVLNIQGSLFAIVRECSGSWSYAIYACTRIIKLTLLRLTPDGKTTPYCQFTRQRGR